MRPAIRLLVALAIAAGAALTTAAPASAYPYPPCQTKAGNHVSSTAIEAWYYRECWEYQVPLPVEIEVNFGGVWISVAGGHGWITYRCPGAAMNTYRTTRRPEFTAACG